MLTTKVASLNLSPQSVVGELVPSPYHIGLTTRSELGVATLSYVSIILLQRIAWVEPVLRQGPGLLFLLERDRPGWREKDDAPQDRLTHMLCSDTNCFKSDGHLHDLSNRSSDFLVS